MRVHPGAAWLAALALSLAAAPPRALPAQEEPGLRAITPSDIIGLRVATDVAVSPDGNAVAIVVEEPENADAGDEAAARAAAGAPRLVEGIWVAPADGSSAPRRLTQPGEDARDPAWSPDGRTIAYLARAEGNGIQVFVRPAAGGEARQVSAARRGVDSFAWSPRGGEIAWVADGETGGATPGDEADEVDRADQAERADRAGDPEPAVAGARSGPPRAAVRVIRPGPRGAPRPSAVWILDLAGGTVERATPLELDVQRFDIAPDGSRLAVLARNPGGPGNRVVVVERPSGATRELAEGAGGFGTRRRILDWSPDGTRIAFARNAPAGRIGHWIGIVPADGGPVDELLTDHEGVIMRAAWDGEGSLVMQTFEHLGSFIRRVDVATGETTLLAEAYTSYPGFDLDAGGRVLAFLGEPNDAPMEAWTVRLGADGRATSNPTRLTRLNPHIEQFAVGDARATSWTSSRDGETIEGVLITPPGYTEDRSWPTVVQIHGGPHFHWGLGWQGDWHDWGHLLASNGFVVLLPNPRGSTGRGRAFAEGIERDLGGVAFQDILDGAHALIARGIADPERIGVGGWSWGGFLTAVTVTRTDVFSAAVMGAGISNHFSHAGSPGIGRTDLEFRFGGDAYTNRATLLERSPVTHAADAVTPTLIVHGENDGKISVNQAWEFYHALLAAGVTAELVLYPGAGHGLSNPAQQRDYLGRVLCWYDTHLRDGTGACAE